LQTAGRRERLRVSSLDAAFFPMPKRKQARKSGPAPFSYDLVRCVSPLAASLPGTNSQRHAIRLFTSVTALFIPKFCGKLLQLWTIFETIIAIAISAPTIRITSCDDLIFDLPMTRIFKSLPALLPRFLSTLSADQISQKLGRASARDLALTGKAAGGEFFPLFREIIHQTLQYRL
jgi:hypothetical protein